ncbi:hypothetical protein GCM10009789_84880 [Kribbella sancticallisti]|uniref:Sensor histidine kinase n=1 Tax=Kribbella sancticallisti TaxID=460087 RepID=A0ABP4QPH4_9ACTN
MSRNPRPVRRPRRPTVVLVIVVLALRIAVFVAVLGLAAALLRRGQELSVVVSSIALLATAAAAAGTALTRNVLSSATGR